MSSPHDDQSKKADMPKPQMRVINIPLRRNNSILRFYPSIISDAKLPMYQTTMATCQLYRQYTFGPYPEPRVHVMLSSLARRNPKFGYGYHGVKMLPLPIDLVPEFEELAKVREWRR